MNGFALVAIEVRMDAVSLLSCSLLIWKDNANDMLKCMAGEANLTEIALRSGIHDSIQPSQRQKTRPLPKGVCSKAIRALIGACWMDSSRDMNTARGVLNRLASFGQSTPFSTAPIRLDDFLTYVDPRALEFPALAQACSPSINGSLDNAGVVAWDTSVVDNNWEDELFEIGLTMCSRATPEYSFSSIVGDSEHALNHMDLAYSHEESVRAMSVHEPTTSVILYSDILSPNSQLFLDEDNTNSVVDQEASSAGTDHDVTSLVAVTSTYMPVRAFRSGEIPFLMIHLGTYDDRHVQKARHDNLPCMQNRSNTADNYDTTARSDPHPSEITRSRAFKSTSSKRARPGTHLDSSKIRSYIENEIQKSLHREPAVAHDRFLDLASLEVSIRDLGLTGCAEYAKIMLYTPLSCSSIMSLQSVLVTFRGAAIGQG